MWLTVQGRLEPHPWARGPEPDLLMLLRSRIELSGWDSTFSSLPGPRQELFGLLEAELAPAPELARFRVVPADPDAVHRYLPALGLAADDALRRLGVLTVEQVTVRVPGAGPASLPYLQAARSWFGVCDPESATDATLTCDNADRALATLAARHVDPFAVDPTTSRVRLPEPTLAAATWLLAAVASASHPVGGAALTLRLT